MSNAPKTKNPSQKTIQITPSKKVESKEAKAILKKLEKLNPFSSRKEDEHISQSSTTRAPKSGPIAKSSSKANSNFKKISPTIKAANLKKFHSLASKLSSNIPINVRNVSSSNGSYLQVMSRSTSHITIFAHQLAAILTGTTIPNGTDGAMAGASLYEVELNPTIQELAGSALTTQAGLWDRFIIEAFSSTFCPTRGSSTNGQLVGAFTHDPADTFDESAEGIKEMSRKTSFHMCPLQQTGALKPYVFKYDQIPIHELFYVDNNENTESSERLCSQGKFFLRQGIGMDSDLVGKEIGYLFNSVLITFYDPTYRPQAGAQSVWFPAVAMSNAIDLNLERNLIDMLTPSSAGWSPWGNNDLPATLELIPTGTWATQRCIAVQSGNYSFTYNYKGNVVVSAPGSIITGLRCRVLDPDGNELYNVQAGGTVSASTNGNASAIGISPLSNSDRMYSGCVNVSIPRGFPYYLLLFQTTLVTSLVTAFTASGPSLVEYLANPSNATYLSIKKVKFIPGISTTITNNFVEIEELKRRLDALEGRSLPPTPPNSPISLETKSYRRPFEKLSSSAREPVSGLSPYNSRKSAPNPSPTVVTATNRVVVHNTVDVISDDESPK